MFPNDIISVGNIKILDNNGTNSGQIIVFVHGMTPNKSGCWFEKGNIFYMQLLKDNFRLAFMNLEPYGSIINNAIEISTQLNDINSYYLSTQDKNGLNNYVCVCHSKGGLDLQAALVN